MANSMELQVDEVVIKEGNANHQRGVESVGGYMWLTNQRLFFQAHNFNVQTGSIGFNLEAIRAVEPCWTLVFGFLPLMPNSIKIVSAEGEHRFVVFGRKAWIEQISQSI